MDIESSLDTKVLSTLDYFYAKLRTEALLDMSAGPPLLLMQPSFLEIG
jgi:hypothetical protein